MSNSISLSNLIQLIGLELSNALSQAPPPDNFEAHEPEANYPLLEKIPTLQVSDIELDLPAHIQVRFVSPTASSPKLVLTLPSLLENQFTGHLGRVCITIKSESEFCSEKSCD